MPLHSEEDKLFGLAACYLTWQDTHLAHAALAYTTQCPYKALISLITVFDIARLLDHASPATMLDDEPTQLHGQLI
jgi:hypothetical protein